MSVKQLSGIALFYMSLTSVAAQTNRALLVAIDKYPEGSGWDGIHATNDIALIRPMLARQGFKQQHIVSLLNEKAFKSAII